MKPETIGTVRRLLTEQLATVAQVHGTGRAHAMTVEDIERICTMLEQADVKPNEVTVRISTYGGFAPTKSGTVLADRSMVEVTGIGTVDEAVSRLYIARYQTPHYTKTLNHTRSQVYILDAQSAFGRRGACGVRS